MSQLLSFSEIPAAPHGWTQLNTDGKDTAIGAKIMQIFFSKTSKFGNCTMADQCVHMFPVSGLKNLGTKFHLPSNQQLKSKEKKKHRIEEK